MHIVYTTQTTGFDKGLSYRNPRYFDRVESGAEQVTIVGDWPVVAEAYEKAGIKVEITDSTAGTETDPHKMGVAGLKVWLTEHGIEFDAGAKKAELQALIPTDDSTVGAED